MICVWSQMIAVLSGQFVEYPIPEFHVNAKMTRAVPAKEKRPVLRPRPVRSY